jgi:hypothetical protein
MTAHREKKFSYLERVGFGDATPPGARGCSDSDVMNDEKSDLMRARATSRAPKEAMDASQTPQTGKASKGKAPAAQDRWFDTQLSRMYADLAAEPLPKEMMTLLEKLKTPKA